MRISCAAFAAASLVASASALLSAPRPLASSPLRARRPIFRARNFQDPSPFSLRSSLEETFETEAAASNETLSEQLHDILISGAAAAAAAPSSLGDASQGQGSSPQEQFRQVLSSPDLLDPASILDATIGITGSEDIGVNADFSLSAVDEVVTNITNSVAAATVGIADEYGMDVDSTLPAVEAGAIGNVDSTLLSGVEPVASVTDADSSLSSGDAPVTSVTDVDSTLSSGDGPVTSVTDVDSPPSSGDGPVTSVTDVDTPFSGDGPATSVTSAARSKEEDLELTLQAIMNHIKEEEVDEEEEAEEESLLAELSTMEEEKNSLLSELSELSTDQNLPEATTSAGSKSTLAEITPSVAKILRYTLPAIGIWLCSPVLSTIDTAAVGLLAGTAQQAALNPAISVTDYGALVVAFMYTATTNLIAAAVQEDKDDKSGEVNERPRTAKTLVTALKLALLVGCVFGAILGAYGEVLLKLLIGNDALDPTVFSAALRYVQIRALGMPAMVVIGTAQSACLGMQDVKSPLYVLLAAAVVNFFGDVLLVPRAGSAMFGGAAGAAWATVASQYAALLFFGRWLTTSVKNNSDSRGGENGNGNGARRRMGFFWNTVRKNKSNTNSGNVVDVTQGIMELTGKSEAGRPRRRQFRKFLASSKLSRRIRRATSKYESLDTSPSSSIDSMMTSLTNNKIRPEQKKRQRSPSPVTRGFLSGGKLTLRKYLSFSKRNFDRAKAREFLPFVVPVTTTSVGRISGYIAMSHVASSTLGTFDMAAHQIIFSIFCCLTPFVDALSQVAQSFVPAVFEAKVKGRERAAALRKTIGNFRKVGAGFGAVLVGLVACIPLIGRYFTTDPIVLERVNGAIPGVGLFMLVHGLSCVGEGTMLGQKDLKFLRNMYAIFFFTVPAYMLRLKHRALTGAQEVGIGTMWAAFSVYNLIRTSTWHLRLAQLQRRTERGIVALEEHDESQRHSV